MGICNPDASTRGIVLLRATDSSATTWNQVASFRTSGTASAGGTAETHETTTSADTWKTYRKGLKDGGEFSPALDFLPDDAGQALIKGDWTNEDCPHPYMIYNPSTDVWWQMNLLVTAWGADMQFSENEITRMVGFKVSGEVTEGKSAITITALA